MTIDRSCFRFCANMKLKLQTWQLAHRFSILVVVTVTSKIHDSLYKWSHSPWNGITNSSDSAYRFSWMLRHMSVYGDKFNLSIGHRWVISAHPSVVKRGNAARSSCCKLQEHIYPYTNRSVSLARQWNTHVKINLSNLKNIPAWGAIDFEASQNIFDMHAVPSSPWLKRNFMIINEICCTSTVHGTHWFIISPMLS